MNTSCPDDVPNLAAKRRLLSSFGEPLFLGDWDRVLFLNFEVNREALQSEVPFELDLWEGRAYVTLVAFTLRRLRFRLGGSVGRLICGPIAEHEFLNVRTYVRHRGEPGIFFLTEWVPNRLARWLGPATFGLPYRLGELRYDHDFAQGKLTGTVRDRATGSNLNYFGRIMTGTDPRPVENGSRDEFLLERYTAFTTRRSQKMFFRIWHEPWLQSAVEVQFHDRTLLTDRWSWFEKATFVGAHFSSGARDVWMGFPHRAPRSVVLPSRFGAFLEFP
mgnify:CR=1 FL=1|jgi:Uncharacterized conserved protein